MQNDQIRRGNTYRRDVFLGQPRHCICKKCVARFVSDGWVSCSCYCCCIHRALDTSNKYHLLTYLLTLYMYQMVWKICSNNYCDPLYVSCFYILPLMCVNSTIVFLLSIYLSSVCSMGWIAWNKDFDWLIDWLIDWLFHT